MKKFCILLLVAIALVACEKENESVIRNTDLQEVVAQNKVSLKEALLYAENSINGINPTTRSAERKVKSTEIYVAKPATRSAESTEVSFYLINYEDNEGFAMVSTDSRTTPVYAYADKGNITANDLETNPFYNIFMDGAVPYYEYEVANYEEPEPIIPTDTLDDPRAIYIDGIFCYKKTDDIMESEDAYVTTSWDQENPYNYCLRIDNDDTNNNYVMGCAPVAAAQIMAFHEWPATYGGYTFNYTLMKSEEVSTTDTPALIQAANLIHKFAVKAETEFGPESSTSGTKTRAALVDFGYNCSNVIDYDPDIVKNNINQGLPVLMFGQQTANATEGGHSWVIDEYKYEYKRVKYYYSEFPYALYKSVVVDMATYFRCNTGWGVTQKPMVLSNAFTFFGSSFNYEKKMICNIEPNN